MEFITNWLSRFTKKRHCIVGCKTSLQHNSTDLINLLTLFCWVSCCICFFYFLRRCQMNCTCTHLVIWLAEAFGKRPKSRFYASVTFRWWRTTLSFFVWNNNGFCYIIRQRLVKKRIDLSAKMRKSSFWQSFLEKTNNSLANLGLFSVDRLGNTSARFLRRHFYVIWTGFYHCLINLGLFIILNFN